ADGVPRSRGLNPASFGGGLLDDDARRLALAVAECRGDLVPDTRGDGLKGPGVRTVWLGDDDRMAAVGGLADREVGRDSAEELGAELLGFPAGAAMAEDVAALAAMGAEEIAHVLDDAEHGHVDLAEHVEALARIEQRDVLRRRDDDGAGERYLLRHGELH